ncbi:MAG: hypothetical protein ACHP7N_09205 [Caulobacterales bacterium]
MSNPADSDQKVVRYADGRFGPGNPGRRAGSRNRASQRIAMAILSDFEEHQADMLRRLRVGYMPQYVRLLAHLLPHRLELGLPEAEDYSEGQVASVVAQARAILDRIETGAGSLIELEAVVLGETVVPAAGK